jgi:hypothetical protein
MILCYIEPTISPGEILWNGTQQGVDPAVLFTNMFSMLIPSTAIQTRLIHVRDGYISTLLKRFFHLTPKLHIDFHYAIAYGVQLKLYFGKYD